LESKIMGNLLSRRPIAECSGEGKSPILRREVLLPVNQFAALLARNALDDAIPPPPLNGRSGDPRLAVTELVSNAVRHAGLETDAELIHLRIEADDAHVRVEVEQPTSASDVHVAEQPGTDERPGGFGLRLVEVFADAWGFEPGPPGRVWFEFRS
jgi:hypothetical protein